MPKYYVGLDFGTHQTKICIKNTATRPQSYSYLEFKDLQGKATFLFPSIVHIDRNNRINYGFVESRELYSNKSIAKSEELKAKSLFNEPRPQLKLPPKPEKVKSESFVSNCLSILGSLLNKFSERNNFQEEIKVWEKECLRINNKFNSEVELWERNKASAMEAEQKLKSLDKIDSNKNTTKKFYYFKLACFNLNARLKFLETHDIEPERLATWYVAYLLFCIEEKIGADYFLQMGIPSGLNQKELDKQKQVAFRILISAYRLKDKYDSKGSFLDANLQDLKCHTVESQVSDDLLNEYMIDAVPEAFAGLRSFTKKGKLTSGIHLLVDIGGGTTDVALFTINKKEPQIYAVKSMPLGLNTIFEQYLRETKQNIAPDQLHRLFMRQQHLFAGAIKYYHVELKKQMHDLVNMMEVAFKSYGDNNSVSVKKLYDAIDKQPIVFCGGGSIFTPIRMFTLQYFKDHKILDKKMIGDVVIQSKGIEDIFPILINALGLSEPLMEDVKIQKVSEMFSFLKDAIRDDTPHDRYDSSDKEVRPIHTGGGHNLDRIMNRGYDPYDLESRLDIQGSQRKKKR